MKEVTPAKSAGRNIEPRLTKPPKLRYTGVMLSKAPFASHTIRSSSSLPDVRFTQKVKEAIIFLRWRFAESNDPETLNPLFEQLDGYRSTYESITGRRFADANVLEIGFGARPQRLLALMSMGINVRGIDLDRPMLRFSLGELRRIYNANGVERVLKTAVRSVLFDGQDRSRLSAALKKRGYSLRIDPTRFLIGDATTYDYGSAPFDLIYSEDVFEHIPKEGVERLVDRLARVLAPRGLALITPNVFTGITGNHLPDWYLNKVDTDEPKSSEPWEHLRKNRFVANTFLNRLSRADYREIFRSHFEILEEKAAFPDLGRRWLTPEVRTELAQWSEEELFSNQVRFVLRPKA